MSSAEELCAPEQRAAFEAYLEATKKATEIERQSSERPKSGVFLGVHAINPVNGEKLPVYAADYVLAEYGTGAVMGMPGHDQRDLDFARAFGLPVRIVLDSGEPHPDESGIATKGDGVYVNAGPLTGLTDVKSAVARTNEVLGAAGTGRSDEQGPRACSPALLPPGIRHAH